MKWMSGLPSKVDTHLSTCVGCTPSLGRRTGQPPTLNRPRFCPLLSLDRRAMLVRRVSADAKDGAARSERQAVALGQQKGMLAAAAQAVAGAVGDDEHRTILGEVISAF